MTARNLRIKSANRYPELGEHDSIAFDNGVNVIVGELQAGKTTWLRMIDYALGDTGKLEEAFDAALAEKYERVKVVLAIGEKDFVVERKWKESGAKTKIFLDGERLSTTEFSASLLRALDIPLIHIPIGNPFERTWPELSWRELFRHLYKAERPWGGFAEKQPDVTRSACLLHFLGAATSLYPEERGIPVRKKKEKERLEAQKDVFAGVMQEIAVELVGLRDMTIAVTPDSVARAREQRRNRLLEIDAQRDAVLASFDKHEIREATSPGLQVAKQRLAILHEQLGQVETERNDAKRRRAEIVEYVVRLGAERDRFARVVSGASLFADLKVTHCPACDQVVPERRYEAHLCAVCGQAHPIASDNTEAGGRRITFEQQQVTEELDEFSRLIEQFDNELNAIDVQVRDIEDGIEGERRTVEASTALAIRAIPPELALLDHEAGQIAAQLQQLERVERAIGSRESMSAEITALDEEIAGLDAEIRRLTPSINYNALGDLLADRMNDYLNAVNADSLSRWKTGRASVKLRRDDFAVHLDGQPWTVRAGGTAGYLLQLAYHYALLSLGKDGKYNYPGFLIIDFPPHFSKAGDLRDSENYLLKPFVDLCSHPAMAGGQVIIAGRAFDDLLGANVIRL